MVFTNLKQMLRAKGHSADNRYPKALLFTALLLLLAVIAMRTVALVDFPAYIHNDESAAPIYIYPLFLKPGGPFALWGFNGYGGHCNLGPWLGSLGAQITGENTLWTARLSSATSGILSVVFCALALNSLYGLRITVFFLAAVAPFHLHIHYARTGFTYIHAVLMSSLVFWAFARCVKKQSLASFAVLGASLGLAVMAYSATHVLPAAVGAGLLMTLFSPSFKEGLGSRGLTQGALKVGVAVMLGIVLTLGPQIIYVIFEGFPSSSRLHSQLLLGHSGAAWTKGPDGQALSLLQVIWNQIDRTLAFFYSRDSAVQYGGYQGLFELWSGALAGLGGLVLLVRSLQRDAFAVVLIATAVSTVLGSAMMVEGSFSPHLIVFSILGPIGCAFGMDALFRVLRIRSVVLTIAAAVLPLWPWAVWNYEYLKEVDRRKFSVNTWLYHLPIQREDVLQLANISKLYADFGESMYPLMYPKAKMRTLPATDALNQLQTLISNNSCPCVAVIDPENERAAESLLQGLGKNFQKLGEPRVLGSAYYIP